MKLLGLFLSVASLGAIAGNGSSGGGHIYGDQLNPWFLQNTKEVSYCVEIDKNFSNLDEIRVKELVRESISIWKSSLSQSHVVNSANHLFKPVPVLGTQTFLETNCNKDTDIKFQMGFLTQDQLDRVHDITQTIGLAYRTSYDQKYLKAKGFVYIAPEKGVLRPSSKKFAKDPWSYGKNNVLLFTLIHELGHVFGLQDIPFREMDIMSRHFVENITSTGKVMEAYKIFDDLLEVQKRHVLALGVSRNWYGYHGYSMSSFSQNVCNYLEMDCSITKVVIEGDGKQIRVYQSENDQNDFIGSINLESGNFEETKGIDLFNVWLPKKQKVYKVTNSWAVESVQTLINLSTQGRIMNAEYTSKSGMKRKVNINFQSPLEIEVSAVIDGKYYADLFSDDSK